MMDHQETTPAIRVAIVGSGLAGLATAYLLQRDVQSRYVVTLFEEGNVLSLDSASVSVPVRNQSQAERIDLPMRAFAGGYYKNLKAMYEYLGAQYQAQPFVYGFSKSVAVAAQQEDEEDNANTALISPKVVKWVSYFAHSSNLHRMPPDRPEGMKIAAWLMETVYVLICYLWFSICCRFVKPKSDSRGSNSSRACESLDEYLHRIRLPQYFTTYYVLPVLSSIATCSHQELLNFPASDVTEYKRMLLGQQHYRVSHGVQDVQDKLSRGISTRLLTRVSAVEPLSSGVRVRWTQREDAGAHRHSDIGHEEKEKEKEELFDRVILAVSPDVVGKIFSPLQHEMSDIPTVSVESTVHTSSGGVPGELPGRQPAKGAQTDPAQAIYFRTSVVNGHHRTEAVHIQPSGAMVTTCPFSHIDPTEVIKSSRFTRVLRTPESRRITNYIVGDSKPLADPVGGEKGKTGWRNGDGNVWLVGGWCWDGMVLLEGCVTSAMRVADSFNVQIPWRAPRA